MNPVETALWYVESHLREDITLDQVAAIAGVSKFHLARAFAAVVGAPVMRYVRARRLTEAARVIATCETDILDAALEFGYGSHEAFARAFREQFDVVPHRLREPQALERINLMEAVRMNTREGGRIEAPAMVDGEGFLVAGISRTHHGSNAAMPAQWGEFAPWLGHVPGQRGNTAYGVLYNDNESGIDYLTGVEVAGRNDLPDALAHLAIAPQRYAVFQHRGHVSTISATWQAIWSEWFPNSGYQAVAAPMLERYPETFDPVTGNGGFEIWIPVERAG
jgi:AraC family transcriptional regulator